MAETLNAAQKRARMAGEVARFVQAVGRRTRRGLDSNDRRHDREVEARIKRMPPEELDRLLREDEG